MKLITLFLFLGLLLASPIKILTPDEDSFYSPPDDFKDADPGTILKFRKSPYEVRSVYFPVNIKNSWQILVRSEDALGNATAIVATIFEPFNANSSRLVAYNTAEDAANTACSPSYTYSGGGGLTTIVGQIEMFLIQTVLNQGYYVVATDYEGPLSTFTVGPTSGLSALNAIRATLKTSNTTNIDPNAEVVLWGYSGGTIPSAWGASLAPTYAKDLSNNLKGVAVGGWVTNITSTAEAIDGTIFVGLAPNAIVGLSKQYPDLKTYVDGAIYANKSEDFYKAYNMCLVPSCLHYAYQQVFTGPNRYAKEGWGIFSHDLIKQVLSENTLGINATKVVKPDIPIFVFHGIHDEIVPFKDAQRVYDVWCDEGINSFEFAVSTTSGHILEAIEGSGAAISFIKRIFEGGQGVQGCKRTERVTNLLYPGAVKSTYEILVALVRNVLGERIGPGNVYKRALEDDSFEIRSLFELVENSNENVIPSYFDI